MSKILEELLYSLVGNFHKREERIIMWKQLYALTFSGQAALLDPEHLPLVLIEGRHSPFALIDQFYLAGMDVLSEDTPVPPTQSRFLRVYLNAAAKVVEGTFESFYMTHLLDESHNPFVQMMKRIIGKGQGKRILNDYLAWTHHGDMQGLEDYLKQLIFNAVELEAVYKEYSSQLSAYYLQTLPPEVLLKQIFIFQHLKFLRQHASRSVSISTKPVIFRPVASPYHHGLEILLGTTQDSPGLFALYSRILTRHGFHVVSAQPKLLKDGSVLVWLAGYFPHEFSPKVQINKVLSDIDHYLRAPTFSQPVRALWQLTAQTDAERARLIIEGAWRAILADHGPVKSMALASPAKRMVDVKIFGKKIEIITTQKRMYFLEGLLAVLAVRYPRLNIVDFKFDTVTGPTRIAITVENELKGEPLRTEILGLIQDYINSPYAEIDAREIRFLDSPAVENAIRSEMRSMAASMNLFPQRSVVQLFDLAKFFDGVVSVPAMVYRGVQNARELVQSWVRAKEDSENEIPNSELAGIVRSINQSTQNGVFVVDGQHSKQNLLLQLDFTHLDGEALGRFAENSDVLLAALFEAHAKLFINVKRGENKLLTLQLERVAQKAGMPLDQVISVQVMQAGMWRIHKNQVIDAAVSTDLNSLGKILSAKTRWTLTQHNSNHVVAEMLTILRVIRDDRLRLDAEIQSVAQRFGGLFSAIQQILASRLSSMSA